MAGQEPGRPPQESKPEVVVAIPHLGLFRSLLAEAQIPVEYFDVERSEPLGLARVKMSDNADVIASSVRRHITASSETVRRLFEQFLGRETCGTLGDSRSRDRVRRNIETVLAGVRALCADRYDGWLPTVGKNRLVGWVVGGGEVSHGSGIYVGHAQDPRPLRPEELPRTRRLGPGQGVRVGVLDTRVSAHELFAGRVAADDSGLLPVSDGTGEPPPAAAGHATFVTGIVLDQAPNATVEVRRVLGDDGFADSWRAAREIVEFGKRGVDVLNLSFVCYSDDGQPPMAMAAAIDRLSPSLVVVAAAGNHAAAVRHPKRGGDESRFGNKAAWPAALNDVTAVGACSRDGQLAEFSPDAPWVDLCANGVKVKSTYLPAISVGENGETKAFPGEFAEWSGTSFSAALVSGAIAARVVPGRTSASEALEELMDSLHNDDAPRVGRSGIPLLQLPTRR